MDWYLHGGDPRALSGLRREISGYLRRHAEPDSDVADAELIVEEVVGNAIRHAGGPIWVSVSWRELQPALRVLDLGPGFDPALMAQAAEGPLGTPLRAERP